MSHLTGPTSEMNGNPGVALRVLLADLNTSAGALAALTAALGARAAGHALAPSQAEAVDGVLETLGVRESVATLSLALLAASKTADITDGSVVALAIERKAEVRTEDDADIQRLISAARARVHVVEGTGP